jgi:hypothetical protein
LALRYSGAEGHTLAAQIDDLASKGILPPVMKEWSHEVRLLGNDSAHPQPGGSGTEPKDARDVVEFLGFCRSSHTICPKTFASIVNARSNAMTEGKKRRLGEVARRVETSGEFRCPLLAEAAALTAGYYVRCRVLS